MLIQLSSLLQRHISRTETNVSVIRLFIINVDQWQLGFFFTIFFGCLIPQKTLEKRKCKPDTEVLIYDRCLCTNIRLFVNKILCTFKNYYWILALLSQKLKTVNNKIITLVLKCKLDISYSNCNKLTMTIQTPSIMQIH